MSILGLTGDARWPRLGVLRKGAPKPNEKQPGKDLGEKLRFVAVDQSVADDWMDTYGNAEIEEITVRLPYASVDENWQAYREHWVSGGLVYRCDGRQHILWQDGNGEYVTDDPRPCPGASCQAKPVGRLDLICLDFARLGAVTLLTTSINDIRNIDGCIRALALTVGDLSRIPMRLTRVTREISTPSGNNGKRARRKVWLLHLEAAPDWVRAIRDGRAAVERLAAADVLSLPAPEADEDTGEILNGTMTNGNGHSNGYGERIAACTNLEALRALFPEIKAIEMAPYRDNVMQLWYARGVELIRAMIPKTNQEGLEALGQKLDAIPDGTAGKIEAAAALEAAIWSGQNPGDATQQQLEGVAA